VNLFASQIWRARDKPRYYPAWIAILCTTFTTSPFILQVIGFILNRRNKARKEYLEDIRLGKINDDQGIVTSVNADGNTVKKIVDISMLDLTDLENKKFIYPL
jgi:hypothetical protein